MINKADAESIRHKVKMLLDEYETGLKFALVIDDGITYSNLISGGKDVTLGDIIAMLEIAKHCAIEPYIKDKT